MFCTNCGAQNEDNAYKCVACSQVLHRAGDPGAPSTTWPLVQSILVTVLCCMPLGVVGIVYAAMAASKVGAGDYATAARHIRSSNIWSWIGAGVGILFTGAYIVLMVIGAAAGTTP